MIFVKSFWEYLVAYGAVNSMLENMLKSGKVYDFDAHTELIKRRTMPFVGLWFLFGFFSLISVIPFFWVPCGVLAVFFVLVFQGGLVLLSTLLAADAVAASAQKEGKEKGGERNKVVVQQVS